MLNNFSISSKLKILLLLSASILIIIFSSIYIYFGSQALKQSLTNEAGQLAELSAERLATAINLELYAAVDEKLRQIGNNQSYEVVCVYNREANAIAYLPKENRTETPCPNILSSNSGFNIAVDQGTFFVSTIKNIWVNNTLVGAVFVARSDEVIAAYINEQIGILTVVTIITLVVYFFIAMFLQSIISKPIIEISNSAKDLIVLGGHNTFSNSNELQIIKSAVRHLSQHINSQLEKFSNDKKEKEAAFINIQGGLDKLIDEYEDTVTAISTYHDIQKNKSLGGDISKYSDYHMDVYDSILNYNAKLESFKHISDVYYKSILDVKVEVQLASYLDSFLRDLKKRLPFLKVHFESDKHNNSTIMVYEKAWSESFSVLTKLFDTITAIVPFDAKLSISVNEEMNSLLVFFYDTNLYESGVDCLNAVKGVWGNKGEGEESMGHNNHWLSPKYADAFLEDKLLELDQLKYILDMISYINTANGIYTSSVLEKNMLGISLGFANEKLSSRENISLVIE